MKEIEEDTAAEEERETKEEGEKIGVFLAKFNPLTSHHERTIEAALGAGIFEKLVVVASDITPDLVRTPVLDRQNMVNYRYHEDERVVTFIPHTSRGEGHQPWVKSIVAKLRKAGYSPVSVFLLEDYTSAKKRSRLRRWVAGDVFLVLCPKDEQDGVPVWDEDAAVDVVTAVFEPPPSSSEVRKFLVDHPEVFGKERMFELSPEELPLSTPVREYIYHNQLYHRQLLSGNAVDAFRSVFGTHLARVLGRLPTDDKLVRANVNAKLKLLGLS